MTGREIFLNQLAMMAGDEMVTEFWSISEELIIEKILIGEEIDIQELKMLEKMLIGEEIDIQELKVLEKAKEFQVPENLLTAFHAYYLDYLYPDSCIHECGAFWSGEDILNDVRNKIFYFFDPIFSLVTQNCPELRLRTVIEPYYDDSSSIIYITQPHYGSQNRLAVQVVLYENYWKVWHSPFRGSDRAEDIYQELLEIYNITAGNADKAVKLLTRMSTTPA